MATGVELTSTGCVILGMLSLGKNTGYEIKQFVDKSTRHFWAASYGQIYPELTEAGHEALRAWLVDPGEPVWELRCETMLKLFFSDAVEPRYRAQYLRAFRELQEDKLEQLRSLVEPASAGPEGPRLSMQFGLAQTAWLVDWCRETEDRLPARIETA